MSSFVIIMLDSRKNKIINLYSNYTKLQALTFAAITSICISLLVHHGLAHYSSYSVSPVVTYAYGYECDLVEEMMMILLILLHHKQTHMTHTQLGLQKQNKDVRTFHEQENKMVYSFNRFEFSFSK